MMGGSYVVFSMLISLVAYALPHVRNGKLRGGLAIAASLLAVALARAIFQAYLLKAGLSMRSFFFDE